MYDRFSGIYASFRLCSCDKKLLPNAAVTISERIRSTWAGGDINGDRSNIAQAAVMLVASSKHFQDVKFC